MSASLVAAVLVHEIATLVLVGRLFFMLFAQLPAISGVRSPRTRLRLRRASLVRLFRSSLADARRWAGSGARAQRVLTLTRGCRRMAPASAAAR
ncbi:MAG: hypothetical protein WBG92_21775 [Thiohalocapsa sp.]